ncbi:MoxR family ATPase [Neiella sp. HB171785]|uniref:MoxR family ATPase n=1 Tax=Neiella litorisoli TaxID=2771431 RepID=A0A8J6QVB4_9GAMM|nr:MoxR family ATPase [Neiella litorisoli]MBD1390253.1 MoxR family ATPase [Neiella litorisoli]
MKQAFDSLARYMSTQIIGQPELVENMLVALLAEGHILVEGPPGLAKTRAVKALSDGIEGDFQRIQFTPDLLPADLTGSDIYRPEDGSFQFQPGPLFHPLILADEINRAPAKVQSALLEAMAEQQITVGGKTYPLPDLFMVMATQNPIEQEGTYPLPEAQLDRFLMHLSLDYPDADVEQQILRLNRREAQAQQGETVTPMSTQVLFAARQETLALHMAESVERYLVELIIATRQPQRYSNELAQWLSYGVSPRASIALERCARAHAWLQGNDFVSPDNVQAVFPNVMRHRLLLSYQAEASGVSADAIVEKLLQLVPAP